MWGRIALRKDQTYNNNNKHKNNINKKKTSDIICNSSNVFFLNSLNILFFFPHLKTTWCWLDLLHLYVDNVCYKLLSLPEIIQKTKIMGKQCYSFLCYCCTEFSLYNFLWFCDSFHLRIFLSKATTSKSPNLSQLLHKIA